MNSYDRATKHVQDIKAFYIHFAVYGVMACFFFGLNVLTSFGTWWFYWPLLGWGIGLTIHFITVFFIDGSFSKEWEEDQIKKYMGNDDYYKTKETHDL